MTFRVGPLLDTSDLSRAELCALKLDGEVFEVDELVSPIDQPDTPALRAAAFARIAPAGAVAESASALWIYGIAAAAPAAHSAAFGLNKRMAAPLIGRVHLRQVVLGVDDVLQHGETLVMSPLRTLLDLTRLSEDWTGESTRAAASVIAIGRIGRRAWLHRLDHPHHLPHKRRATARIDAALALLAGGSACADPVHVVDAVHPTHGVQHPIEMSSVSHLENEPAERQARA